MSHELARLGALLQLLKILVASLLFHFYAVISFLDGNRTILLKLIGTQVHPVSTKERWLLNHACCVLSSLQQMQSLIKFLSLQILQNKEFITRSHPTHNASHVMLSWPVTDTLSRTPLCNFSLFTIPEAEWRFHHNLLIPDKDNYKKGFL